MFCWTGMKAPDVFFLLVGLVSSAIVATGLECSVASGRLRRCKLSGEDGR